VIERGVVGGARHGQIKNLDRFDNLLRLLAGRDPALGLCVAVKWGDGILAPGGVKPAGPAACMGLDRINRMPRSFWRGRHSVPVNPVILSEVRIGYFNFPIDGR
jgi:hypothetical protein